MNAPTWADLGERAVWLAYHRYRAIRKRWRRWRVSRRKHHPIHPIAAIMQDSLANMRANAQIPTVAHPSMWGHSVTPVNYYPIYDGLQNVGLEHYRQQTHLLQNVAYEKALEQYQARNIQAVDFDAFFDQLKGPAS